MREICPHIPAGGAPQGEPASPVRGSCKRDMPKPLKMKFWAASQCRR
jgi:hypothetical protein